MANIFAIFFKYYLFFAEVKDREQKIRKD